MFFRRMIFLLFLTLFHATLGMNPISPRGHSALWGKYALKQRASAAASKLETPQPSPTEDIDPHRAPCSPTEDIDPHRAPCSPTEDIDPHRAPCSPVKTCPSSPAHVDTPQSVAMDKSASSMMSLEECLEEKMNIDRALEERAKLGPFLLESNERPVIVNFSLIEESVQAIRKQIRGNPKSHLYDNVDALQKEYEYDELNRIDVIAIRLYTTSIAFVVNEALRNYSLNGVPVPTSFLPYIYALLNGLAKLDNRRRMYEENGYEQEPWLVARYIPVLSVNERAVIQAVLDAHQPGAYVMYSAFTSTSFADRAINLWRHGCECRFEIKSQTSIPIENFSINPNEFEEVFPPGTIFHLLECDGSFYVMEEITPKQLRARKAELPC